MAGGEASAGSPLGRASSQLHRSRSNRQHRSTRHRASSPDVTEVRKRRTAYYENIQEVGREASVHASASDPQDAAQKDRHEQVVQPDKPRSRTRTSGTDRRDSGHGYVYPKISASSRSRGGQRTAVTDSIAQGEGMEHRYSQGSSHHRDVRPSPSRTTTANDTSKTSVSAAVRETRHAARHEAEISEARGHRHKYRNSMPTRSVSSPIVPTKQKAECLTCASEFSSRKTAKLACGHVMCHTCLRHVFVLSTTDPAHMPPRCCTAEHIPLEHVEQLFDYQFKRLWNRKFKEFKTSDRLYCPNKDCGAWIKPSHIYTDLRHPERKYGECKRCNTRVCASCNNKYHKRRECPNDPATVAFIASAQENGWRQCFACKAMVELREGCNHMTCRCKAQFCMLCGLPWKTCDCPWFKNTSFNMFDRNPLQHMRVPYVADLPFLRRTATDPIVPQQRRAGTVPTYQEELDALRRQELEDEDVARRLQRELNTAGSRSRFMALGLGLAMGQNRAATPGEPAVAADNTFGVGNATGHFLNDTFVRNTSDVVRRTFDNAVAAAGQRGARDESTSRPTLPQQGSRRTADPHAVAAAQTATAHAAAAPLAPSSSRPEPAAAERRSDEGTAPVTSSGTLNAAGLKSLGKNKRAEKKQANFGRIAKNGGTAQGAKSDRIMGWLSRVETGGDD